MLEQILAAPPLVDRFSRRFLREAMIFPFDAGGGRFGLAVADPTARPLPRHCLSAFWPAGSFCHGGRCAVRLCQRSALAQVRPIIDYHRTGRFCRSLMMLSSGVMLTSALRILVDTMEATGTPEQWSMIVDKVRHGGKLSDALTATRALPPLAIRTLRLGEDSGQLATLAGRVADFYEAKLQRSLDRAISVVGPLAIIAISLIVGGLIVSVMTALLSVYQVVD